MHFSFSTERFLQSRKYSDDIEHDASVIADVYREKKEQGLFRLTHDLVGGKDCGMKLVKFEFNCPSEIKYLMAVRSVRSEMIRILEQTNVPDARAIVGELNRAIRENRDLDGEVYRGLDGAQKTEPARPIDFKKDYEELLEQYPAEAEASAEQTRVPITVGSDEKVEFSPFLESSANTKQNEKRREE